MTINDYGFLGKEIEIFRAKILQEYNELLNFYKETNHFLQKLKFNLRPKESEDQNIAIVTLFNRALETFQSIYILSSYGLINDAEILNRILYETLLKILYCSKGENNYRRYIATDIRNGIKSIKIIKNNLRVYPKEIYKEDELDLKKSELEAMLKEIGNPPEITIKQMAKETGMEDMHDSFYQVACQTVHTSPRILGDYIAIDREERIKLMWGPRIERIDVQLFAAIEFMLRSCQCLSEIFGKPQEEEIISINKQKESIYLEYKKRK